MGQGNGELQAKIDSLVEECNELRNQILAILDEHNQLSSRMNELK